MINKIPPKELSKRATNKVLNYSELLVLIKPNIERLTAIEPNEEECKKALKVGKQAGRSSSSISNKELKT